MPIDDINLFKFDGWTLGDYDVEISYWTDALDNPEEYEVDFETAESELENWKARKELFIEQFEAQRPKLDYEDGTWV